MSKKGDCKTHPYELSELVQHFFIPLFHSCVTQHLLQEPMRFILMSRSMFELQQEPMRFILVLRIRFELLQEPMRFTL